MVIDWADSVSGEERANSGALLSELFSLKTKKKSEWIMKELIREK